MKNEYEKKVLVIIIINEIKTYIRIELISLSMFFFLFHTHFIILKLIK